MGKGLLEERRFDWSSTDEVSREGQGEKGKDQPGGGNSMCKGQEVESMFWNHKQLAIVLL